MIGRLRGVLELKRPPHLLIDVNGVGYELQAPMSTIYSLPGLGQACVLYTHVQVREDAHVLYGFLTETERTLFRTLIKISGVGPKLGLAILSGMEVAQFVTCIEHGNTAQLVQVPGVGKKTAERLLIEMRDKLSTKSSGNDTEFKLDGLDHQSFSPSQDAISALIALGYKNDEAQRAVKRIDAVDASSETLIRKALQGLSKI